MSIALLAARAAVFAVFAVSGIAKLTDVEGTRQALRGFGLGESASALGRWGLPLVELLVAGLMLAATTAWWGSLGALALLALFSAAIGANLSRGRQPECRCFGQFGSAPVSARTLVRNALLAVPPLLILVAGWTDAGPSALTWLDALTVGEQVLLVLCLGLTASVVGLLIGYRRMAGSIRVLEALFDEHLERRPAPKVGADPPSVSGLPVGAPMPDAMLLTLHGESVGIADLCDASAPTALIFVSSGCSACSELLDGLDGDTRDPGTRPKIVLIARGSPASHAPLPSRHAGIPLLFDRDSSVADAFRAGWTPAAVLVSPDGTIASDTRFGKAAIDALLAGAAGGPVVPSGDPKYGERVPEFSAVDSNGMPVGHGVLSGTRGALLYWSPACGYCQAMEDELSQWATDPPPRAPRLVLLTGHTAPLTNRFNADVVITDTDGAIARRFGLVGTPSAVLTSADGTIASAVGVGADDVKALLGGFGRTR